MLATLSSYFRPNPPPNPGRKPPPKPPRPPKPPPETDWPVPEACWPKSPFEACPWPELDENPPGPALEIATPVEDTPNGLAFPVPKPAPEPPRTAKVIKR